jgi:hypothetical protein
LEGPLGDRWRPVPSHSAFGHAEGALLSTLPLVLREYENPFCGLTGGLDSRVVAVAMKTLGVGFDTFTFGDDDSPDVTGAPAVARSLRVPHRVCPVSWASGEDALHRAKVEQRWHEGAKHLGLAHVSWPADIDAWVTGNGGETGRAFYYRGQAARDNPDPTDQEVRRFLTFGLQAAIAGADAKAHDAVARAVEGWIERAASIGGVSGWRLLDLIYADQRLSRWLRGMATHTAGVPVPALATTELQRGLVSMSLKERLSDGFHRRFISRHAPEALHLPTPDTPGRSGPLSRARSRLAFAQPSIVRQLRSRRSGRPAASFIEARTSSEVSEWLSESVLSSATLEDSMGVAWCKTVRERFLRGDGQAEEAAMWAGGPIALAEELRALS